MNDDDLAIAESPHFLVSACIDCDVPGYLIVRARPERDSLVEMPAEAQHLLGPTVAKVESAVKSTTQAEKVYVLRFSEGLATVHFHVFPRTDAIAKQWRHANPNDAIDGVDGPLLFSWARKNFKVSGAHDLSEDTAAAARALRVLLRAALSEESAAV